MHPVEPDSCCQSVFLQTSADKVTNINELHIQTLYLFSLLQQQIWDLYIPGRPVTHLADYQSKYFEREV